MFSNKLKTAGAGLMLVLVVVGLLVGAVGGAVAQDGTDTPTPTETSTPTETPTDGEIANSTVEIDNDTRSVYADLEAGENESDEFEVSFIAIDEDGNESDPETETVDLNESDEELVEYDEIDTTEDAEYRVVVETVDGEETNATAEVGTIQKVAGGGGGINIGGQTVSTGVLAVVVLVAGLFLARRSD